MLIKLGIIAGIVILGGMIFSTEIGNIFPTTSATVFDSFMDDVTNFGTTASDSVDQRIDESLDKIVDKTSNSITNEISEAGNKITNDISKAKESSQKTINEEISNFNPIESITNIFTGSSSSSTTSSPTTSSPTTSSPTTSSPTTSSPTTSSPITYETLSLSTTQQSNDNILLQYSDSSGKTQSVSVVIRTEQKEIFSGIFFTSMFETTVNDATGIPYYVDMVVEHEDYGTVTSSVFNTGDASDSKINGIFFN
jgi:hypothetical protein